MTIKRQDINEILWTTLFFSLGPFIFSIGFLEKKPPQEILKIIPYIILASLALATWHQTSIIKWTEELEEQEEREKQNPSSEEIQKAVEELNNFLGKQDYE